MKAVVLEISENEATVMTHDGDIIGIRNKNYDIGQEINIKRASADLYAKIYKFTPIIAAAAAAVVMIAGGAGLYFNPYGTVSLDINPSIEYTINRFDRVLEVNGMNDDGSDILASINTDRLINRNIEDAVDATIEQIEADGYITDEDGNYIVVSANTKEENHTDELLVKLDNRVKSFEKTEPVIFKVTDDELGEAHRQGISAGKKKMVDTLEEVYGEDIDREEWNKKSVREIVKERDRIRNKPLEEEQKPMNEKNMTPDKGSEHSYSDDNPAEKPTDEHGDNPQIDANESVPEKRSERTENESGRNDNNETVRKELEGRPETIEQFRPDESDQGLQHDDHNIPDRQEHPGDWQSSPPQDGSNNGTFPDVHEDGREQENMRGDQPYGGQNTSPDGPPH
jgi:hypothetical protein